nr:unnamed protein product [Callosobruchus chinensis]
MTTNLRYLASSYCGIKPEGVCRRWSEVDGKYIEIKQPAVVKEYNAKMGKYSMRNRTNKWTVRTIFHFVDFAVAAAWLEYRQDAKSTGLLKRISWII